MVVDDADDGGAVKRDPESPGAIFGFDDAGWAVPVSRDGPVVVALEAVVAKDRAGHLPRMLRGLSRSRFGRWCWLGVDLEGGDGFDFHERL